MYSLSFDSFGEGWQLGEELTERGSPDLDIYQDWIPSLRLVC